MTALHLRTFGMTADSPEGDAFEAALRSLDGVRDVASIDSMGLTSVLFDEMLADETLIVQAARAAGFETRPLRH